MALLWLDKTELLGVLLGIVMCGMVRISPLYSMPPPSQHWHHQLWQSSTGWPLLCSGGQDEPAFNWRVSCCKLFYKIIMKRKEKSVSKYVCMAGSPQSRANNNHNITRRMIIMIMLSSSSGSLGAWFRTSHQEEQRAPSLRIWSSGGGLLLFLLYRVFTCPWQLNYWPCQ